MLARLAAERERWADLMGSWEDVVIPKILALLIVGALQAQGPQSQPVTVFLGSIPSAEGFVAGTNRFEDSYRDLRDELKKNAEFRQTITLVSDPAGAQLIVEIVDRGLTDTGARTGTAVATGPNTAVGNTVPVRAKQLGARLAVRGSTYRLDIDGAAGIRLRTYRNQANNVLRQVVDWVKANRAKLVTQ